jgi:hypothetical protein
VKPISIVDPVRAGSVGAQRQLRLHVDVASPAMLRFLWQLQISKGRMSLDQPCAVEVGRHVEVVLVVGAAKIVLAAKTRSCVPQGARFLLSVTLDVISEAQRSAIGRIAVF